MPRRAKPLTSDNPDDPKPASGGKERVRFVFEPDRNSPNGVTFSWLLHKAYDGKEKAGAAARSFWLPFACRDAGNYSEADLKDLAQQCIWRMEEQIQYLRESFNLETPARQVVAPVPSLPDAPAAAPEDNPAPFFGNLDLSIEEDMLGDFGDALG